MAAFVLWSRRSQPFGAARLQEAPIEKSICASGYRQSRSAILLLSLLTLFACLNQFECLPAAAKAPGKGEMILFRATGLMWGATENRFSEHAFSLKSNRGVALWRDSNPGNITLINPENKTYLTESIAEYLDDNHYGIEVPIKFEDSKVQQHAGLDGHPCLETIYLVKPNPLGVDKRDRGPFAGKESMLKSFSKASNSTASSGKASSGTVKASEVKSKTGTSGDIRARSGSANIKSNAKAAKDASIAATPGGSAAKLLEIARVISLKDVALPPSMLKAWTTIMLTNDQSGFPVHLVVRPSQDWRDPDRKLEKSRSLIEYQSIKFVPFEPKSFVVPAGFRKAQDKSAFYLSESGELKPSDIDDLFRSDLK